jgi:hypothetical protein
MSYREEYEAAVEAIDAMHRFWALRPQRGAVQWLEDDQGRVLIFTRGEYRDEIMHRIYELAPSTHGVVDFIGPPYNQSD